MERTPLDAELAERVTALRLETAKVVEGVLSGLHRSPRRGASVVFVEHRDYRPGDDPRLLDWRAFARNDRHVTKHFEQETALSLHVWLDGSSSMRFGEGPEEKARYAATLLASFVQLAHEQRDAVAALVCDDEVREALPARSSQAHLSAVMTLLASRTLGRRRTSLSALGPAAERLTRRGVVIVASDLLDFDERALEPLERLAERGHDVRVFQVLTREELELPGDAPTRFEGLEGEPPVEADPAQVREAYRAELEAHIARMRERLLDAGAEHRLVVTDEPIVEVVTRSLLERGPAGRRGARMRPRWA